MQGHRVFETQDGSRSLFSERFGVSYHSKYGAWQETQHVFIDAGLRYAAVDRAQLVVLDIGYGTGLNAIASLLFAQQRELVLNYTGVEAFPVPADTLAQLDYPTILGFSESETKLYTRLQALPWSSTACRMSLLRNSKLPCTCHGCLSPKLHVTKLLQRFEELDLDTEFDVIYYDAFAPEAQPELWTPERFAAMHEALRVGGILVTYCAKGQVKRDMRSVGFEVERLQGPPGKREMTRAVKVP